jgi:hypothetical protein
MLEGKQFALPQDTPTQGHIALEDVTKADVRKHIKLRVQKAQNFPPVVTVDMDHVVMQGGEPVAVPDEPIDVPVVTPKKRGFKILAPVTEDVE